VKIGKKLIAPRTHRLIQCSGLSDLAGLQDMDDGEFLGALLGMSTVPADDPRRSERTIYNGIKN